MSEKKSFRWSVYLSDNNRCLSVQWCAMQEFGEAGQYDIHEIGRLNEIMKETPEPVWSNNGYAVREQINAYSELIRSKLNQPTMHPIDQEFKRLPKYLLLGVRATAPNSKTFEVVTKAIRDDAERDDILLRMSFTSVCTYLIKPDSMVDYNHDDMFNLHVSMELAGEKKRFEELRKKYDPNYELIKEKADRYDQLSK